MGLTLGGVSIRAAGKSRVGLNSDILVLMIRRVGLTIPTRWFPSLLAPLRRGFLAAQRLRYLGGPWAIPLKSPLAPSLGFKEPRPPVPLRGGVPQIPFRKRLYVQLPIRRPHS